MQCRLQPAVWPCVPGEQRVAGAATTAACSRGTLETSRAAPPPCPPLQSQPVRALLDVLCELDAVEQRRWAGAARGGLGAWAGLGVGVVSRRQAQGAAWPAPKLEENNARKTQRLSLPAPCLPAPRPPQVPALCHRHAPPAARRPGRAAAAPHRRAQAEPRGQPGGGGHVSAAGQPQRAQRRRQPARRRQTPRRRRPALR